MADTHKASFTFTVQGQPDALFSVVELEGRDQLSAPYSFNLTLACAKGHVNPADVVRKKARLSISCQHGDNSYSGLVFTFNYLYSRKDIAFYRAVLAPHMQLLSLTQHNQVFLGQTLPEILEQVFKDSNITGYELQLRASYPALEYVCQYNESNLQFVSRLMERAGIYYYFKEGDGGEVLTLTDQLSSHVPIKGKALLYLPPSGLDDPERDFKINTFIQENTIVPQSVVLKNYNYQHPDLNLQGKAVVSEQGVGVHYVYGDFFQTVDEATRLAQIRAQELLAGQEVFVGEGAAPLMRAGFLFTLANHPVDGFNAAYLAQTVNHNGRDKTPLTSGLAEQTDDAEELNFYRNTFKAIASSRQFRAPCTTPKQKIHGFLSAFIDAEGDGTYAFLDSMGRYKVRLPFDLAGRPDGHASCWLRLAEPYAGDGHGMHFPLLKGTEVFLNFVDGDPDRPVIASTAYNAKNPNLLQDKNTPLGVIKSAASNQIVFNDQQGREFLGMWSPFHNSGIAMGSVKPGGGGSIAVQTNGDYESFVNGGENSIVLGSVSEVVAGMDAAVVGGAKTDVVVGMSSEVIVGPRFEYLKGPGLSVGSESTEVHTERCVQSLNELTLSAGIQPSALIAQEGLNSPMLPIIAMVGTILAGAVETAMSAMDAGGESEKPAGSAGEFFKDIGEEMGLGSLYQIIPFALEVAGIGTMLYLINKQIATLTNHFKTQSTSTISMGSSGIEITAKKQVGAISNASFTTEVLDVATQSKQVHKMNSTDGLKFTVGGAAGTNTFQINPANAANLNTLADITLTSATQTVITATGHGKATVGQAGVTLECAAPPGGKVEVTQAQVKLTAPNNTDAITVADTGIQLNFLGNNLHAGPLSINAAGMIQLG